MAKAKTVETVTVAETIETPKTTVEFNLSTPPNTCPKCQAKVWNIWLPSGYCYSCFSAEPVVA